MDREEETQPDRPGIRRWITVRGRHEGDVRATRRARVAAGAVATGDLVAPRVVVRGVVHGRVLARELRVERGGEVLGDVWVESCHVKRGGRVHGWVMRPEAPLDELLAAENPWPQAATPDPEAIQGDTNRVEASDADAKHVKALRAELARVHAELAVLQNDLQTQVSAAVAETEARAGRLNQALGEAMARATQREQALVESGRRESTLAQALEDAQSQEATLRRDLAALEGALHEMTGRRDGAMQELVAERERAAGLERQLADTQTRVERLIADLGKANQLSGERYRQVEALTAERAGHDELLATMATEVEAAREAIADREATLEDLGNNLVQSQDHVELQHWELKEARERLETLTQELAVARAQGSVAQESHQTAEAALRRAERDLMQVQADLSAAHAELNRERNELAQVREQLAQQTELAANLAEFGDGPVRGAARAGGAAGAPGAGDPAGRGAAHPGRNPGPRPV